MGRHPQPSDRPDSHESRNLVRAFASASSTSACPHRERLTRHLRSEPEQPTRLRTTRWGPRAA
eukprot:1481663-Rhodomonas_salina.1